jgi:hypothetical protein
MGKRKRMTRGEIIDVFIVRAATADRPGLRRMLERMTKEELEQAYEALLAQVRLQAKEEELFRIRAESAADRALHQFHMQKAREPQRLAEEKGQLEKDRETFREAARSLQSFGLNEANFNVIRSTLGPNFTGHSIQQALDSNAINLSPPTQEVLNEWTREAIEAHNQRLRSADLSTLRRLTREAGARIADSRPAMDETQRVRAASRNDGFAYPPLPEEIRIGDRDEVLDAAFLLRADASTLRFLIKRYGSEQVTEALRTRKSDASPLW